MSRVSGCLALNVLLDFVCVNYLMYARMSLCAVCSLLWCIFVSVAF